MEEAGVSLSSARPLYRLGKVGRGRAGISELGEGIPEPERKAGALHGLPGRGVSAVHIDTHTCLPPTQAPRVGARAGITRGGTRGARLRPAPLCPRLVWEAQLTPRRPQRPPSSRELSARRWRPFRKVCTAAGWSSGPPGARSALAFRRISPEVGRDREPLPRCGTSGNAHLQRGTHPCGVPEAGARAPPGSLTHAGLASLRLGATKSSQRAVGRWGGSEGSGGHEGELPGPGQGGGEVSEWAEGPSVGASAEPGALRESRAACSYPLSHLLFHSISAS